MNAHIQKRFCTVAKKAEIMRQDHRKNSHTPSGMRLMLEIVRYSIKLKVTKF